MSLKMFCSVSLFILLFTTASIVQGRYVYQPRLHRWIARDIIVATWDEAQQHCESQGATLASPIDTEVLKYMQSVIEVNNHTTPYFIGIKAKHSAELQFVSQEGILLEDISETVQNMIEQIDPLDGDCLCMDRNSIRVVPCWRRLPYMCYKSTDVTTTDAPTTTVGPSSTEPTTTVPSSSTEPTTAVPSSSTEPVQENESLEDKTDCDSGYYLYPTGSYYKVHNDRVSWHSANSTCTTEGGYLAVINDYAESQILREICDPDASSWVGLIDVTGHNDWRSVKGDDVKDIYNVWSFTRSGLEYAVLTLNGDLDDRFEVGPYPLVCEKDYCNVQKSL